LYQLTNKINDSACYYGEINNVSGKTIYLLIVINFVSTNIRYL